MLKVDKNTKDNYVSPCFVEFDVDFYHYQSMLMNCFPSVSKTKNNLTITDIG